MPKIEVKFNTEDKVARAGRPYRIIEMWMTDRDGGWPERSTFNIMPFHARMLLQSLPEFCQAIQEAEIREDSPESSEEAKSEVPF